MHRFAFGLICVCFVLACSSLAGATEYFICNQTGTGAGTLANPYRMGDLPNGSLPYDNGTACSILQPGDTLTFLAGNYTLNTRTASGNDAYGYIHPINSGTATQPITIRAKPGDTVTLTLASGVQPALGPMFTPGSKVVNYVRFQGFNIVVTGGSGAGVRICGNNNELSYCKLTGHNVSSTDNWDGLRVEGAISCWLHNNEIAGWTGLSNNSSGIKVYTSSTCLFEDNYIHGNTSGIFDKDSANGNVYRRNYLTGNLNVAFYGSNQTTQGRSNAQYYVYENVLDGVVDLHYLSQGIEFHDNLVRNNGHSCIGVSSGLVYQTSLWNNVYITNATNVTGFSQSNTHWSTTPPNNTFNYCDYNVYDATPDYRFGLYNGTEEVYTLAQMQGFGFETHTSTAVSVGSIYEDQVNYVLKTSPTNWTTAGRYGDPVGPDNVAQILDLTRYGPTGIAVAPTAVDDSYSVNANHTLTVAAAGVLANDVGSGALTAIKVTDPSHGSVTLNSDGSFTYTPTTGYTGSDSFTYKAHNTGGDSNNATVNITVNIEPTVSITSPNGGEVWTIGSQATVTWTSTGIVGNVDVDLSTDGGATWTTLVASTPNTGSQSVTVPNSFSIQCQVRVKQTSSGSPSDTSDANFAITVAGDATLNGYVDGGDLNMVLSNWNAVNATWAMGDFTGNGVVDGGDLNLLLSNWNVQAPPATAAPVSAGATVNSTPAVSGAVVSSSYDTTVSPAPANAAAPDKIVVQTTAAAATATNARATSSAFTAQVNFQPASVSAPQGYLVDSGLPYGKAANGYTYGWTTDLSASALRHNYAASPDVRYDTAVMPPAGGTWEISIPNGMYDVKIVCGTGDIGSLAAQNFTIEGVPTTQTQDATGWFEESVTVVVTDGRLTITASPESSICFLQIMGR